MENHLSACRPGRSCRTSGLSVLFLLAGIGLVPVVAGSAEKEKIVPMNESGGWTWFNDPRAIVIEEDLLLVGSVDREGNSRVDLFDLQAMEPVEDGGFALSTDPQHDDHNNPALARLANGQILAAWSAHSRDPFWSWRTGQLERDEDRPRIDWGEEQHFQVGVGSSYCNVVQLSEEEGRIYNFFRGLNFNPNVASSDDDAESWSDPVILFKIGPGNVRPYVKYASNGKDRIDFLFTEGHPRNQRTGILHAYYQGGTLYQTDGSELGPMPDDENDPADPMDGTRIYDGSEQRAWVWDIDYQEDGSPVAVYVVAADDEIGLDLRYHYARWDAEAERWIEGQFAHAGERLYPGEDHYAGGVTLDPQHPGTVYFSSNVDPESGEPTETGRYQVYRGTTADAGQTWEFEQLTDDEDADNLRPYVPREHSLRSCVVWFHGDYRRYADYETRVMGYFER